MIARAIRPIFPDINRVEVIKIFVCCVNLMNIPAVQSSITEQSIPQVFAFKISLDRIVGTLMDDDTTFMLLP